MSYPVPLEPCEVVTEVKKSRFIARAARAEDRGQAMQLLEQAKLDYPDARHHCWAYLLGDPSGACSASMSDDGEPGGTAGKPILNVLQHKGIGDVMVVVIRYFGGIKLGAGGLVRAYSAAAQSAMEQLLVLQREPETQATLLVAFAQEQLVRHWLQQRDGQIVDISYATQVSLTISLADKYLGELQQWSAAIGAELSLP